MFRDENENQVRVPEERERESTHFRKYVSTNKRGITLTDWNSNLFIYVITNQA